MIALYPGAFKPPHRGHFQIVKDLLSGNFSGYVYSLDDYKDAADNVLKGKSEKIEKIDKVVVFIGGKERNGIDREISKKVWEVYLKYLPKNVELYYEVDNPMQNASAYAKKRPEEKFYAVTGVRSEEDLVDLRRASTFKNRDNVDALVVSSSSVRSIRASDFRSELLSGNLDRVIDYFPKELSRDEIKNIVSLLKNAIISEQVYEGSSGTPVKRTGLIKSSTRQELVYLFNYISRLLPPKFVGIFNNDHIRIEFKKGPYDISEKAKDKLELKDYILSLTEYMLGTGMKITPLPEVVLKKDQSNASNFFGRTAYYNPEEKKITLFTLNRHPKDIVRSYSHEMIHHKQNIEGRLGKITTTDTNKDQNLQEIEKEAYLEGNITFRNWEDSLMEDKDGKKAFSREIQISK